MSIFRLLIASLIFCSATFANAGLLYKGTCYPDIQKIADIYKSEIAGTLLQDGSIIQKVFVHLSDSQSFRVEYATYKLNGEFVDYFTPYVNDFPHCDDNSINDAVSLAWKIILVWLAAWALAQLIRIVRKESEGGSDYGHS